MAKPYRKTLREAWERIFLAFEMISGHVHDKMYYFHASWLKIHSMSVSYKLPLNFKLVIFSQSGLE